METNKIDNSIQNQLKDRTFEPSSSAWDRLSVQLDTQASPKNFSWAKYLGIAASILVLLSVGGSFFMNSTDPISKDQVIVKQEIDTRLNTKITHIPVEKADIIITGTKQKELQKSTEVKKDPTNPSQEFLAIEDLISEKDSIEKTIVITNIDEIVKESEVAFVQQEIFENTPKSSIQVNSQDLLYAVTHSQNEIATYYAKNNTDRQSVLKTIQDELNKANLKVDPKTILAEVERTLLDETFENNFLALLKKNISSLATAVVSRNNNSTKN